MTEVLAELEAFAGRQDELRELFNKLLPYLKGTGEVANGRSNLPIFVEEKPGRGKSYLIKVILNSLQVDGLIVLIVGTTALSVIQYERGRTAHHTFCLPVNEVSV